MDWLHCFRIKLQSSRVRLFAVRTSLWATAEIECGILLSNPNKYSKYTRRFRNVIGSIRKIARTNLGKARQRLSCQKEGCLKSWKPLTVGQAVWLKRPKTWKFGPMWVWPYEIFQRLGVDYKIKNRAGKITVVHHDYLKLSHIPFGNGEVIPPSPASGDIQVVHNALQHHDVHTGEAVQHITFEKDNNYGLIGFG